LNKNAGVFAQEPTGTCSGGGAAGGCTYTPGVDPSFDVLLSLIIFIFIGFPTAGYRTISLIMFVLFTCEILGDRVGDLERLVRRRQPAATPAEVRASERSLVPVPSLTRAPQPRLAGAGLLYLHLHLYLYLYLYLHLSLYLFLFLCHFLYLSISISLSESALAAELTC
jgi:hypothetical protein